MYMYLILGMEEKRRLKLQLEAYEYIKECCPI